MTGGRISRRRLLAAVGTGLTTGLAGCGYQPGGGELDWQFDVGSLSSGGPSDETWLTDGDSCYRIRNRSGRTFQSGDTGVNFVDVDDARITTYHETGDQRWSQNADRQYVGEPAVADGRVYLALEDGGVTALEAPADDEDDPTPRWTADWEGPPLSLSAAGDALVGRHEVGVVGFDANDGTERFALEDESLAADAVADIALAGDRLWLLSTRGPGETDADNEPEAPTLYGIGDDGTVEASRSLPVDTHWLETVGSDALLGVDDELWAVAADGDRRFALPLEGSTESATPVTVSETEWCYQYSDGTLEAIDVSAGDVVWRRDEYSFRETPVADRDGIYGWGSGPEMDGCGLAAVTSDGDGWWEASPADGRGCLGTLLLVGDRLVVVVDGTVYGYRKAPGSRYTIV
ncbi:outer membrane protein assembly factor BamB family protein [Natronorubrum texcoconense]|uniref:Outer membrane protein assembly factor BamB, contains PQQ-like beta-propeller repeat n=1 Tax=Natronorubrum texcoconense TaxID=1095776 RepID=A0A1G9EZ46_9EURY|nr:PQQ-binding-like beta-propeller repeat protein [Natronorubrum texcoconense]SDK81323.1 Outer membrane protein assembly factor BamB, contains PQQ-like beta-propeller repeat [Natronorubrum texcoconense]